MSAIVYLLLFLFFVSSIDKLAQIVPGAMCGAGIIHANGYGFYLLALKVINLFVLGIWMLVHRLDMQALDYPHMRSKQKLFVLFFILFVMEYWLQILFFSHISLEKPVLCCSAVFGQNDSVSALPLGLDTNSLLVLFYLLFLLNILSAWSKNSVVGFISHALFLWIGYYALTYFFGTYIYELPSHKCPFCMLQKEYFYIGYVLWGVLFLASFFGIVPWILKILIGVDKRSFLRYGAFFSIVFTALCSYFVLRYYFQNGAFL